MPQKTMSRMSLKFVMTSEILFVSESVNIVESKQFSIARCYQAAFDPSNLNIFDAQSGGECQDAPIVEWLSTFSSGFTTHEFNQLHNSITAD